jgi:hypothetical protein
MSCNNNINPLYNSYFTLVFGRGTTQFELNCQKANLPGCSIPENPQPTIFGTTIPIPTLQFNYEPLTVEFIVDSELQNWKSIYSWMRNMANIESDSTKNIPYETWHWNASLGIYDPVTRCIKTTINFKYIIPITLGGIMFQSDSSDAIIQKASCKFKYSYYEICPDPAEDLTGSV